MWMLWPMVTSWWCKCLFNRYFKYLTIVPISFDIYNWWQELTMVSCWLEWLLLVHTTARVCQAAARCAGACTTTNHDSQQRTSMTRCNSIKHMWHRDAHRLMLFGNTVVSHNDEVRKFLHCLSFLLNHWEGIITPNHLSLSHQRVRYSLYYNLTT